MPQIEKGEHYRIKPNSKRSWRPDELTIKKIKKIHGQLYFTAEQQPNDLFHSALLSEHYTLSK